MKTLEQKTGVIGEIKAEFYDQAALSSTDKKINKVLELAKKKILPKLHGKFRAEFYKRYKKLYRLGNLVAVDEKKNVICNAGFNAITKLLTGDTTYTGEINKALLGDGSGSASATDTELINEAYRNDMASGSDDENIAYLTAFFTEAECSGTFTEFGNCIDGTGTENTGQLWSHIAGLNWVKDTNTALVISCKYTFASV
jgi:hypothetical protein